MPRVIPLMFLVVACSGADRVVWAQKPNSQASQAAAGQATATSKVKVGVTDSAYDDIGSVLRTLNVAFQHTSTTNTPLTDFNCLFVGCGTSESGKFPGKEVRDYVQRGGVLYVSDLAYPVIQQAFPDAVQNFQQAGQVGMFNCVVLDKKLAKDVGPQITLNFDAPGWAAPSQVANHVQVLLAMPQGEGRVPVLISFTFGRGKVVYTSFHNHANANELELKLIRALVEAPLVAARNIQGELTSGSDLKDLEKRAQSAKTDAAPTRQLLPQSVAKMSPEELAAAIATADPAGQEAVLAELHIRKGGDATLALGEVIDQVDGAIKTKARDLLVKRLSRLTAKNIAAYLASEAGMEIRIAAAKAAADKNDPAVIAQLVAVMQDVNKKELADAAHDSLTKSTGQNFGPFVGARTDQRFVTAGKWKNWWQKQP